jgi:fumarate hydratase subunit beta/L(+)-tartrate dehydratase beta subunit
LSKEVRLTTPLSNEDVADIRIGDVVYISGVVYTARDMAHLRIMEQLNEGAPIVEDFEGAAVFHAGPVVRRKDEGWEVIVIGPTTSMRMEPFSEALLGKLGAKALIGKGGMGKDTEEAMKRYCSIYLLSPPGCAVVQSKAIKRVLRVNWLDLGVPEAIWVLEVENWGPLIVGMDSQGNSQFKAVKERAQKRINELVKEA